MTMYYDSKWTLIRLIASFALIFALGYAFCGLIDSIYGEPILHGFSYGNGSVYQVDMKICFANRTLLDKFLANDNETIFKLTIPCPELPKEYTHQEDESGK